jgi:AGZA family xanthine/uracil permease-like MFS transporter
MERFFRLKELGTNIRTELVAGLTTFMTMAYILVVNPIILGGAGLEFNAVFLATALAAGIFTIIMGLYVNLPVALAPGMGLNAYFATVVASGEGITPEVALTAVFISGIIFIILTLTQIRQMLVTAVPDSLKFAITAGIGLFITIIGLKNSGIMTILDGDVIALGSITDPNVWLTIVGIFLIAILMVLRVPGAILLGIILTTIVAALTGNVGSIGSDAMWVPDFSQLNFWHFDFQGVFEVGLITVVLTFTFVELFDTFGTLVGTATRAGVDTNSGEGKKKIGKAMLVDAVSVSGGAVLGTSTVTAYIESSSGIAQGGRSGLTAVTVGVLFLLSLFISPIVGLVPGAATSAALVIVGALMMQSIRNINFTDYVYAIPAFLMIVIMPFTYNIANGISFGIVSYVILALTAKLTGKKAEDGGEYKIHWLMWVLAVLILARYIFMGGE